MAAFIEAASLGRNDVWRYALSFILSLVFVFVGATLILVAVVIVHSVMVGGLAVPGSTGALDPLTLLEFDGALLVLVAWNLLAVALFAPASMLAVRLVHRRPAMSLLVKPGGFRWRLLGRSFVVVLAGYLALILLHEATDPSPTVLTDDLPRFFLSLAIVLLITPLQVLGEEVYFRGYLLQSTAWFSSRAAVRIAVPALLFLSVHLPWLEGVFQGVDYIALLLVYAALAFYLTWLTVRTDGIEASTGLHMATNFVALAIVTDPKLQIGTEHLLQLQESKPGFELLGIVVVLWMHYWFCIRGRMKAERSLADD